MILQAARERLLPPVEAALQALLDRHSPTRPSALQAHPPEPQAHPSPNAPGHYGMMRYHLGWLDEQLEPIEAPVGKRLRPLLCLLSVEACGGQADRAVPAAVALELLHNFTLIHDDVEDGDAVRHHRPTVWKLWGAPQAINAGDGMHVLANLTLLDLTQHGHAAETILALARRFAETSLIITEGQHLDMAFERRDDVAPAEYLDMIGRKSAELVACCTEMGAALASADAPTQGALAGFGHRLGMAFQIRDDVLGIWGDPGTTGKPAGDLHRRKKTLPSLYALSRADEEGQETIRRLFASEEPSAALVAAVVDVLDRAGARAHCEKMVSRYSAAARTELTTLPPSDARAALEALVTQLETRDK